MTTSASRRAPVQHRSQETVQAIQSATSQLLAQLPVEEITTSRIAEAAGLSVGALYRFYRDKQEIFDAIAVSELESFRATVEAKISARRLLLGRAKLLDEIVDAYVEFLDARPHFRALAFGGLISEETRRQQTDPRIGPGGLLQRLLGSPFGLRTTQKLNRKIVVASEVGDRLIAFAYRQESLAERKAILGELKAVLKGYLAS